MYCTCMYSRLVQCIVLFFPVLEVTKAKNFPQKPEQIITSPSIKKQKSAFRQFSRFHWGFHLWFSNRKFAQLFSAKLRDIRAQLCVCEKRKKPETNCAFWGRTARICGDAIMVRVVPIHGRNLRVLRLSEGVWREKRYDSIQLLIRW